MYFSYREVRCQLEDRQVGGMVRLLISTFDVAAEFLQEVGGGAAEDHAGVDGADEVRGVHGQNEAGTFRDPGASLVGVQGHDADAAGGPAPELVDGVLDQLSGGIDVIDGQSEFALAG